MSTKHDLCQHAYTIFIAIVVITCIFYHSFTYSEVDLDVVPLLGLVGLNKNIECIVFVADCMSNDVMCTVFALSFCFRSCFDVCDNNIIIVPHYFDSNHSLANLYILLHRLVTH